MALVDKEATILLEEKDLSGEIIKNKVESLLADDQRRKQLANNALRLGNPDVLNDIIEAIEKI